MPYSASQTKNTERLWLPAIWYLLNLLAIPLLGFVALLWLALGVNREESVMFAHSRACVLMSVLGALLIGSGLAVLWFGLGNTGHFWTFVIVWAIVLHTAFVLWGMLALARAIGGKPPYFPHRWL